MYNYFSNLLANKWLKEGLISKEEFPIYTYGIEIIMSSIVGALLVFVVGSVLFDPILPICFLAVFIPLRCYCGGFHASTYLRCNSLMVVIFVITALLSEYFPPDKEYLFIGIILSSILLVIFAPVDNEKKRLTPKEKKKCKLISTILTIFIHLICLCLFYIGNMQFSIVFYSLLSVIVLLIFGKIKDRAYVHNS